MRKLELEIKETADKTFLLDTGVGSQVAMTPPIDEDYWVYRVRLTETQAVVGFPKPTTIGIGFAVETDWNTNLPFTCATKEIYDHIKHNAGDARIPKPEVMAAIKMIQDKVPASYRRGLGQQGPGR